MNTPHSTKGETPFRLTYGTKFIIPIEKTEFSWRMVHPSPEEDNTHAIREEVYLLEEMREFTSLISSIVKHETTTRYNKWVWPWEF